MLLTGHPDFSMIEKIGEITFYEFRTSTHGYDMPDFSAVVDMQGLYIIHQLDSKPWADIQFIEEYLIKNNLSYKNEEL